jgi:hypothetical protein
MPSADLLPTNSYLPAFLTRVDETFFASLGPASAIYFRDMDVADPDVQRRMLQVRHRPGVQRRMQQVRHRPDVQRQMLQVRHRPMYRGGCCR